MLKNQVFLCQSDYMINCNENGYDSGEIDHINKASIDQDANIDIQNIQKYSITQ